MEGIINLPKFAREVEKLTEVSYCDKSTSPNKITIDFKIMIGDYHCYLDTIANNLGFDKEYLEKILEINQYGNKNGIYRVSIPIIRLRKGSYCTYKINLSFNDFLYGDLIINDSYAQFPIEVTNETHIQKLSKLFSIIKNIIEENLLDTDTFAKFCPSLSNLAFNYKNETANQFCSYCIKTNNMIERGVF